MKPLVFYVPALQRLAAPADTPPEALFFPVRKTAFETGADERRLLAEELAAAALPLDSAGAGAVLDEMLRQGGEHAAGGALKQMAAFDAIDDKELLLRAEMADLARFAAPEAAPDAFAGSFVQIGARFGLEEKRRRALIDCQKVLLLAHYLEERALEIAALNARAMTAEKALLSALGEGGPEFDAGPEFDPVPEFEDAAASGAGSDFDLGPSAGAGPALEGLVPGASWRVVLDAALPFLPEKAVLLTLEAGMTGDLHDAGLLRPLPEDRAPFTLPGRQGGWKLFYAFEPAWRLVGRPAPLLERPWLERELELYAATPVRTAS